MKQLKARHLPSRRAHVSRPSRRQRVDGGGEAAIEFGRSRVLLRQRQLLVEVFRSSSAPAPSTSFWSCWRPTARWSQRRSFLTGCGRAS